MDPKQSGTVKQTIVESVEAPRLTDISTSDFVAFAQGREVYERQGEEKNADAATKMPLTSYRNSISKAILELFVVAGWVSASRTEEITEQELKECVEMHSKVPPSNYDLAFLERELRNVAMERRGKECTLERQVWRLCLKYTSALQKCGYDEFVSKQPRLAVQHIMRRISHTQLKARMRLTLRLRKEEGFGKDFRAFVQELGKEAQALDRHDVASKYHASSKDYFSDSEDELLPTPPGRLRATMSDYRTRHASQNGKGRRPAPPTDRPNLGSSASKRKRELPDCLNPKCGGKHFINDCQNSSLEEKRRYKRQYHDAKRSRQQNGEGNGTNRHRTRGGVRHIEQSGLCQNSSLFSASFCNGAVNAAVMADSGSDITVLPSTLLSLIIAADKSTVVRRLDEALKFSNAHASAAPLECSREVELDVELRIRHGERLILRNVKWLVSDAPMTHAYLGRHLLAALGMDNRVLMAAARDRLGSVVDVPALFGRQGLENTPCAGSSSSIHGILAQRRLESSSTFHSAGVSEEDGLEDADVYIDLGDDSDQDLELALAGMIEKARDSGLTETGARRLRSLLSRYKAVFESGWGSPDQPTSSQ